VEECFEQRLADNSVEVWFEQDNADSWSNEVILEPLSPFFQVLSSQRILTLGDGKGAKEARWLQGLGHSVVATDVETSVLKEAHSRGYIEAYAEENAEALSYEDGAFDYSLVKQSLHHMQRPYAAIYEMIRVAQQGAVMIEPHYRMRFNSKPDPITLRSTLSIAVKTVFRLLRGQIPPPVLPLEAPLPNEGYEESGNYCYQFNPYELTQVAMGLGLAGVAFTYAHSPYHAGDGDICGDALAQVKGERKATLMDEIDRYGIEKRPILIFIFLCRLPEEELLTTLRASHYTVRIFDGNPVLDATQ
jgi:SAM-dependent methyltransferase